MSGYNTRRSGGFNRKSSVCLKKKMPFSASILVKMATVPARFKFLKLLANHIPNIGQRRPAPNNQQHIGNNFVPGGQVWIEFVTKL